MAICLNQSTRQPGMIPGNHQSDRYGQSATLEIEFKAERYVFTAGKDAAEG